MTRLRIAEAGWAERPVAMRLPFQFGNTEVWGAPEAHARVVVEIDGAPVAGRSAQLMVPRWFDKRTDLSNDDTVAELRACVAATIAAAPGREGTALSVSRDLRRDIALALPEMPALAAGFGPALIEMAVIDAVCAHAGLAFWEAAREDLFGLTDGVVAGERAALGRSLSRIRPPGRIALRHTVGFDAPLTGADTGAQGPEDGLPVALVDVIASTGISAFKIKLKGEPGADLARLAAVAGVIGGVAGLSVTLDANEQYERTAFDDFLAAFLSDPALAPLAAVTRFVEQPFSREIALEEPVFARLPLVIDESDDGEGAFAAALALGWSGTSIKSCKGVLRALLNKGRAEAVGAILSGEDLTCQPGLCWQQDTAMMAACGVPDVERNGHHFAGGLQGATAVERRAILAAHPDIYTLTGDRVSLRIVGGEVAVGSLGCAGFGNTIRDMADLDATG